MQAPATPPHCKALLDMERQREDNGDHWYNAESLWRAAGSPEGLDPHTWLRSRWLLLFMGSLLKSIGLGPDEDPIEFLKKQGCLGVYGRGDTAMAGKLVDFYAKHLDISVICGLDPC